MILLIVAGMSDDSRRRWAHICSWVQLRLQIMTASYNDTSRSRDARINSYIFNCKLDLINDKMTLNTKACDKAKERNSLAQHAQLMLLARYWWGMCMQAWIRRAVGRAWTSNWNLTLAPLALVYSCNCNCLMLCLHSHGKISIYEDSAVRNLEIYKMANLDFFLGCIGDSWAMYTSDIPHLHVLLAAFQLNPSTMQHANFVAEWSGQCSRCHTEWPFIVCDSTATYNYPWLTAHMHPSNIIRTIYMHPSGSYSPTDKCGSRSHSPHGRNNTYYTLST